MGHVPLGFVPSYIKDTKMDKYLLKVRSGGSEVIVKATDYKSLAMQTVRIFGIHFIKECNVFRFDPDYMTWINSEVLEEALTGVCRPVPRSSWNEERDDIVYEDDEDLELSA